MKIQLKPAIILLLAAALSFASCKDKGKNLLVLPLGVGTPSINAFVFTNPVAVGAINRANDTIAVEVPYETNVTALAPTIAHTGASVSPASGVTQDFTNPVTYTIASVDGSTQEYTVTLTVAEKRDKLVTSFKFASPPATGIIDEKDNIIAVTVPYGTTVTSLTPAIIHTGASINPASGAAQNFTNPVNYTVTAADGTTQTYAAIVFVGTNTSKVITGFSFPSLDRTGTIDDLFHTISVSVPDGTDVTALVPEITHTGADISPASGVARNFTNPVTYTVTAVDGSTQGYTVSLINEKFPTVTTTEIAGNLRYTVDIAGTSASGGGNVTSQGNSGVIVRGLCWNKSGGPTISDSHVASGSGTGEFYATLSGLSVATLYHVRAFAVNNWGTAYGKEIVLNSGYAFGTDIGGGYVFYNNGSGGGMVSAKYDQGTDAKWSPNAASMVYATGTAVGTGQDNTIRILNAYSALAAAAYLSHSFNGGGYTDWFLPSLDEMYLMNQHLFLNGLGGLAASPVSYWTSSEIMPQNAYTFRFGGMTSRDWTSKISLHSVRAVRVF